MFLLSRFQKHKHSCVNEQEIDIAPTWRSPSEWPKTWWYKNWSVLWLVVFSRLRAER
jgi:hypothetical protein